MFSVTINHGRERSQSSGLIVGLAVLLFVPFVFTGCSTQRPLNALYTRKIPDVGRGAPSRYVVRASQYAFTTDFEMDKSDPLIHELEHLRDTICETLDIRPSATPVRIVIFENRQSYHEFLAANFPGLPERRAFFIQEGKDARAVFACQGERLRQDLRHETTHALLHSALPDVPLWLDEGIAEYFEFSDLPDQINPSHVDHLRQAVINGWEPDLPRLEKLIDLWQVKQIDYRESWLWIHFCLHHSPQTRKILLEELRDLGQSDRPLPLSDRLLAIMPDPRKEVLEHLHTLAR